MSTTVQKNISTATVRVVTACYHPHEFCYHPRGDFVTTCPPGTVFLLPPHRAGNICIIYAQMLSIICASLIAYHILVDRMTVFKKDRVVVRFKNGVEIDA